MKETPLRPFFGVAVLSLGHMITDVYPSFLPALLPLIIDRLNLSFTRASLLASVLVFCNALTQPIFGYFSDKMGGRFLILLGPVLAGVSLSLIGMTPSYYLLLILLICGGLGVASYHPEAAALATSLVTRQRNLWMSLFMIGGNLGYGLGPFLILGIILHLGLKWSFLASSLGLGMAWILYRYAPIHGRNQVNPVISPLLTHPVASPKSGPFILLLFLVILRVTIALSVVTYLPILQKMRGFSLLTAGSSITLFMVFAGLGGLSGGYLADRFGRRTIIVSSFIFIIPVYVAFLYWQGSLSFLSLALMGFLLFLTEPPCIVMAQEMIPRNARTASGLIMGMSWGVAGFGVLGVGILADLFGVRQALTYILALPAVAIFFSCFLPRN